LRVRQPEQRVMISILGRGQGVTDPGSWRKWYNQGRDFFGYAWGTPPSFLPTAMYDEEVKVVKAAFAEMQTLDAAPTRNTDELEPDPTKTVVDDPLGPRSFGLVGPSGTADGEDLLRSHDAAARSACADLGMDRVW